MKHINLRSVLQIVVLISLMVTMACTENWNDHYDSESFDLPTKTLRTIISENSDLSKFSQMLEISGYVSVLNASQSYTVWAPQNNALSSIDLSDVNLIKEIVENHIARSRYTTSNLDEKAVRMLNGKYITFQDDGSGFNFGDIQVTRLNIPAVNGLLHVIDGYAPFLSNLWEYIDRTDNMDSLRSFLYGKQIKTFDVENSTVIGYNSDNSAIYDSIFITSNEILDLIGHINYEDSAYTAILPDNAAWNEAYNRIEKYYNFPYDAGSVGRKRTFTTRTLVQDMLFRGRLNDPASYDSLVSTYGNVFYNPAGLFENTQKSTRSNGIAYVTSQMPFIDTISWFKKIRVEAEYSLGRINRDNNIFLRNSYGTGLNVSNNWYILADPTSSSSKVKFSIPKTLSASYNIYCVFVPASIVNEADLTPYKVSFKLTTISSASGNVTESIIQPVNNTTNPNGLTKMFVKKVDFQYANYDDEDFPNVDVKLEVLNEATTAEEQAGTYSRTMRIDCIILEPVL